MAVDTRAALAKLTSGQALSQAEKEELGLAPATPAAKTIDTMTKAEIDAITAKQVAAGGMSNDQSLTIPGETNAERNARISAGTGDTITFYNGGVANTQLAQLNTAGNLQISGGIYVNSKTIGANYTIPSGSSGMSTGPITISSGVTVTVSSGSKWVVL